MYDLKRFFIFVFMLFLFQQSWSQQFELAGTDATNSACNGEIQLVSTDVEVFDYEWNTGETGSKHLTGLCPGFYSITITLPDGCIIDLSIQLSGTGCYMSLDNFSANIVDYCNGGEAGSIDMA